MAICSTSWNPPWPMVLLAAWQCKYIWPCHEIQHRKSCTSWSGNQKSKKTEKKTEKSGRCSRMSNQTACGVTNSSGVWFQYAVFTGVTKLVIPGPFCAIIIDLRMVRKDLKEGPCRGMQMFSVPPKLNQIEKSEDEEHLSGGPGITISHHASIALLSVHKQKRLKTSCTKRDHHNNQQNQIMTSKWHMFYLVFTAKGIVRVASSTKKAKTPKDSSHSIHNSLIFPSLKPSPQGTCAQSQNLIPRIFAASKPLGVSANSYGHGLLLGKDRRLAS